MAHLHEVHDSDIYFVIDPITREIKTESKKILLVQGDHNAERFTFRLPKLIEFHDMTECDLVTIHFINISGTQTEEQSKGVYEVNDVHVCSDNEDEIEFTWLISENATKYAGTLAFCIRFECTTNGIVDYRWQTGIHKNIAVTNIYFNGNEVLEAFPDILAQWKAELFEAGGDSVVNVNVASEKALEAIRTEGTTQIEAIQEAGENIVETASIAEQNTKNVLANAIKGHLKGEVVTADDISSVEHEMAVKVMCPDGIDPATVNVRRCGKNLFEITGKSNIVNGVTFTVNKDGTVNVNGTATANTFFQLGTCKLPSGQSCSISGSPKDSSTKTYMLYIHHNDSYIDVFDTGSGENFETLDEVFKGIIVVYAGVTANNLIFSPMIEYGTTVTTFEPYKGTEHTTSSDGTVSGMMSTAPNMTILTDTEGVVIDCEYIVDTKTYIDKKFEELKTAILAEE